MKRLFFCLVLASFLHGCGEVSDSDSENRDISEVNDSGSFISNLTDRNNISLIKNGLMDFDKTLTVGEAFDNWKNCSNSKNWEFFESDNGKRVVQFSCKIDNSLEYMQSIKKSLAEGECSKPCPHLDILENEMLFQWTINKDDTFQISYGEDTLKWNDGKTLSNPINVSTLKDVYSNKVTYSMSEPVSDMNAQILSNIMNALYAKAKTNNSEEISATDSSTLESAETSEMGKNPNIDKELTLSDILGEYSGSNSDYNLEISVKPSETEGLVNASIHTYSERCDGTVEGKGSLIGNELTFTEADEYDSCTITLAFNGDTVETSQNEGCSSFHGAACTFLGQLKKN